MQDKKNSKLKTVSLVMVITLVGKVLGLVRDMLLGHNFGTGMEAEAFLTASRIPRTFFDTVFASAITSSFIPVFNEHMEKKGKKAAFDLSGSFLTLMGLLTILMSVLGILFSDQLTALFARGYDAQTAALCSRLLRVLFPTVFFTGIAFSIVGILQSLDEFNVPAAMSIVSNGIVILYYVFFRDTFGIFGLAVAFLVGWAAQALFQVPSLVKKGYRYRISFWHPGLKSIFFLMLPVMVSTWIQPINLVVSTRFASWITGGVAAIEYANTLYTMVGGILVLSVTNVIFPEMSRLIANGKKKEFGEVISRTTRTLLFLLIPMTVGLCALGTPIVKLLYQWKDWDALSTELTSQALFFLAMGMVGYGVQTVLSRGFYAAKNGKTPLVAGLVSIGLNVLLSMLLVDKYQVAGLAFASAVSATVSALILIVPTQRMTGGFITKKLCWDVLKMLACAAIMGVAVVLLRDVLTRTFTGDTFLARAVIVLAPAALGVCVYMVAARCLRLAEARQAFALLKRRGAPTDEHDHE